MTAPLREGNHRGKIIDWGIQEPRDAAKSLATAFSLKIEISEFYDPDQSAWCDITAENSEIMSYTYLTKKDGSLNETSINELKAALGWDGRSFEGLHNSDLFQHGVQFSVKSEEYNGKYSMKASFLKPFDADPFIGTIKKADASFLKRLDSRLASNLRALAPPPVAKPKLATGVAPSAPGAPTARAPMPQHPALAAKAATANHDGSDHAMVAAGDKPDDLPF